jgi:predicted alpha/beta hydrolase family esterase
MKNAIIVHGKPSKEVYYSEDYPSSSNFAWIPWLQKQLIIRDIKTDTPEMPYSYKPQYSIWKTEFERFEITQNTILIGHSVGAGFLIRWLSENKDIKTGKVILVAPSIDPYKKSETGFCDFEIDKDLIKHTEKISIFTSDNDSENINESVKILKTKIPDIKVITLKGKGHFIPSDTGTDKFPEILEEIFS